MLELTIAVVKGFLSALFVRYPGATIRYVVSGKKQFEEYLEDDIEYNIITVLSSLTILVMTMLLYRLAHLI
ncbi:MAG: hypothetical protein Q8M29_03315 [Bacteroidota bacterium]|nr:hypothetical protein [Bacteroidota bacterium]